MVMTFGAGLGRLGRCGGRAALFGGDEVAVNFPKEIDGFVTGAPGCSRRVANRGEPWNELAIGMASRPSPARPNVMACPAKGLEAKPSGD